MALNRFLNFKPLLTVILLTAACVGQAQQLPSLCQRGEFAYLNAKMPELRYPHYATEAERKSKPVWILRDSGKILSICADRQTEPFNSLAYRFGENGKVEFEKVATALAPFYVFTRATSPHTGDNVLFFRNGAYVYCVMEATAQGSGISLTVLKAGREVASYFSGNDRGTSYEAGLIDLSFDRSASPALRLFSSPNPFKTPCDGQRLMRP